MNFTKWCGLAVSVSMLGLVLSSFASAAGLYGHWGFDTDDFEVKDLTDNGYDGYFPFGESGRFGTGVIGRSLQPIDKNEPDPLFTYPLIINGQDDGTFTGFDPDSAFSLVLWVKINKPDLSPIKDLVPPGNGLLISRMNDKNDKAHRYGFELGFNDKHLEAVFRNNKGEEISVKSAKSFSDDDNWIHLAMVYDGSRSVAGLHLFEAGGELVVERSGDRVSGNANSGDGNNNGSSGGDNDSAEQNTASFENKSQIFLGAGPVEGEHERPFWGELDDVRIYNLQLGSVELTCLSEQGFYCLGGKRGRATDPQDIGSGSLVGKMGEKGVQGDKGAMGITPPPLEGRKGENGVSVKSASLIKGEREKENLQLIFSNGKTLDLGRIRGRDGKDGEDKKGEPGDPGSVGKQGEEGQKGPQGNGIASARIDKEGNLLLSLSNGKVIKAGKVRGDPGDSGEVLDGEDGADGVGIAGMEVENGNLSVNYTNNTRANLGRVKGNSGDFFLSCEIVTNRDRTSGVGVHCPDNTFRTGGGCSSVKVLTSSKAIDNGWLCQNQVTPSHSTMLFAHAICCH